jgi:GAF domain-containing protein
VDSTSFVSTANAFSQLQSLVLNVSTLDSFLQQLAELATRVVDPPASCGIDTRLEGRPLTVSSSDQRARLLDETQIEVGGPCVQTLHSGQVVYVSDFATEQRWALFTSAARDQGLKSSLSLPLVIQGQTVGAMNLFAFHAARAFDGEQQQRGAIFAAQASGALQLAARMVDDNRLLEQLEEALTSRSLIDQALGIVIAQRRCTADAAFAELQRASSHTNRKLRDVAVDLVQRTSGQAPTPGKPFRSHRRAITREV